MVSVSFNINGNDYNLNDVIVEHYPKVKSIFIDSVEQILKFPHFFEMKNIVNIDLPSDLKLPSKITEFIYLRDIWIIKNSYESKKPDDFYVNNNKMFINKLTKNINIPSDIQYLNISLIDKESLYKLDNLPQELEYLQIRIDEDILYVCEQKNLKLFRNLPHTLKQLNLILEGPKEEFKFVIDNIKLPLGCEYKCIEYY
jgi:hypothetical protein